MKFGTLLKNTNNKKFNILKSYFGIGAFAILLFFIIYTNILLKKAREDAQIVPNLFARFMSFSGNENFDQLLAQYIIEEVIYEIDYPIIVTDGDNVPLYWKNIQIEENVRINELPQADQERLSKVASKMIKHSMKVPLRLSSNLDKIIGYVYFDESPSLKQLRYLPYVEMLLLLIFFIIGIVGIFIVKKDEKNLLWVGLAKETAHQFGTPITSLMGWIDILEMEFQALDNKDILSMLNHIRVDVDHLKKIAFRFGKVGSSISFQPTKIHNTIENTIKYFETRIPKRDNAINIHHISNTKDLIIDIDEDLITWTLENLIKNCLDSMQLKGGNIIITTTKDPHNLSIVIKDEGKGIQSSMFHKIFEPGVTSKSRGWGLGLSLTKRIVEDFHNGKIRVLESTLGEGSTFEVSLPLENK